MASWLEDGRLWCFASQRTEWYALRAHPCVGNPGILGMFGENRRWMRMGCHDGGVERNQIVQFMYIGDYTTFFGGGRECIYLSNIPIHFTNQ